MKKRIALAFVVIVALAAPQAVAQTTGFWKFDEGSFQPGCPGSPPHNPQGHIVDWSGTGNHGCLDSPNRNVKYITDAFAGPFALHLNDPADAAIKFLGYVFIPHSTSLEPPTGMIEAAVKIREFPPTTPAFSASAPIFTKSTFQFVRREPGMIPIFCCINGQPRIVGRGVYQLGILPNGFLQAFVGNDDLNAPGPWTTVDSGAVLAIGVWNQVAMKWDGCQLSVTLNGSTVSVPYNPVPILGLSYQGTGNDPTLGPLTLPAQMGPIVGQMDEVRISNVRPCNPFTIASTRQLISSVRALNLQNGLRNSLVSILEQVVASLGPDPTPIRPDPSPRGPDPSPFQVAAVNQLGAFINHVEAQRGKKIPSAAADALIAVARQLIAGLTTR